MIGGAGALCGIYEPLMQDGNGEVGVEARPAIGRKHTRNGTQQRRLAASVFADDAKDPAFLHWEGSISDIKRPGSDLYKTGSRVRTIPTMYDRSFTYTP